MQVKNPHQRSPYASKFEGQSHEETERQQRYVRSKTWNLVKNDYKLNEKDKATFYSSAKEWILQAESAKEQEERDFVVDSGASVHTLSKKDFNSAELETMRTSRSPTTKMTSNDEMQTIEDTTIHVKDLDLFVTIMFLEETPAVLSLGKLCEDHGQTYHWSSDQKSHLFKKDKRIDYNISNYVSFVLSDLSTSSCTTSTSSSSSSSSQDSVLDFSRYIENKVHERNESTNEKLWRNPLLKRKQKYK